MKKNVIKFTMGLCLVAMLGGSSVNLNASGGGGGDGDPGEWEDHTALNMYLYEGQCNVGGGCYYYCWNAPGHRCAISSQTSC
jgi:hypothetical protein